MDREPIYAALWARLANVYAEGMRTRSRRPRHFSELQSSEMPAMFLEQGASTAEGMVGSPSRYILRPSIRVYVYQDDSEGPFPTLNAIVHEIEFALRAEAGEPSRSPGATTLGGLVAYARVVEVQTAGEQLGALGEAVLTVEMLTAG